MNLQNDPYKLELIEEHSEDEGGLTIHRQGVYVDLCRGPPAFNRSYQVYTFHVAGAYWRGNSDNAMMQRICFNSGLTRRLEEHLQMREAKERPP